MVSRYLDADHARTCHSAQESSWMPTRQPSPSSPDSLLAWCFANRRPIAASAGGLAVAYLAYRAYHSESAKQAAKLRSTLVDCASAISALSSSAALVACDIQAFLASDSSELPPSLRQLNALLQSKDVQESVAATAASVARGVSQAVASQPPSGEPAALDKLLDAILSERGQSLIGMAVGLATKNATQTFCSFLERMQQQQPSSDPNSASWQDEQGPPQAGAMSTALALLASDQGERIISLLITKSIKTAVSTYVDATLGYNVYDDMMASIAKQEHREAVSDIMGRVTAAFCKEVVSAYRRSTRSRPPSGSTTQAGPGLSHPPFAPSSSSLSRSSSSSLVSLHGHLRAHPHPPSAAQLAAGTLCGGVEGGQGGAEDVHGVVGRLVQRRSSADAAGRLGLSAGLAPAGGQSKQQGLAGGVGAWRGGSSGAAATAPWLKQHLCVALGLSAALHQAVRCSLELAPWCYCQCIRMIFSSPCCCCCIPCQVVQLAQEREVRSLALDVVKSASAEAARGTVDALLVGLQGGPASAAISRLLIVSKYQLAILASILLALSMYVAAPRAQVM
ncbi:hypothetical protein QJQ45_028784 [Haematococcus lacustris]|nr:hypothetical protein QJQ45_028784 [Haematococcus lacustris]